MPWWMPHTLQARMPYLKARQKAMAVVRSLMDNQGFIEVQTPALQVCPTIDTHIHAFRTQYQGRDGAQTALYLHTSPEFAMKKLLVGGMERIYQLGPVYRNGEQTRLHSPEFTLLEWYRAGADYWQMMADCEVLLRAVAPQYSHGDKSCDPAAPWRYLSVRAAFEAYLDFDLDEVLEDKSKFNIKLQERGIRTISTDQWDDLFHAAMAVIEPELGRGVPCILYDYPLALGALARRKAQDPRYVERFELYVCGVELANAFSELTEPQEQRARAKADMAQKQVLYGQAYPLDEGFFAALDYGLPECAGCALGFDRLVMLACGAERLSAVQWAPVEISD